MKKYPYSYLSNFYSNTLMLGSMIIFIIYFLNKDTSINWLFVSIGLTLFISSIIMEGVNAICKTIEEQTRIKTISDILIKSAEIKQEPMDLALKILKAFKISEEMKQ